MQTADPRPVPPRLIRAQLSIVTPQGRPVPYRRILLQGKYVQADAQGQILYEGMHSHWYPEVKLPERAWTLRIVTLLSERRYQLVVGQQSELATLEGMVLRREGTRVAQAIVTLYQRESNFKKPVASVDTDGGGRFVCCALLPGRYRLQLKQGKTASTVWLLDEVTLHRGQTLGQRFTC